MEEENNNKYLSLEENFPGIFNFFKHNLPDEIWEEWIGDLEENIQKKTKYRKYSQWQIKILYFLAILPIFHSARKMGFLDFRNELAAIKELIRKRNDNTKTTTEGEKAYGANDESRGGEGSDKNPRERIRGLEIDGEINEILKSKRKQLSNELERLKRLRLVGNIENIEVETMKIKRRLDKIEQLREMYLIIQKKARS